MNNQFPLECYSFKMGAIDKTKWIGRPPRNLYQKYCAWKIGVYYQMLEIKLIILFGTETSDKIETRFTALDEYWFNNISKFLLIQYAHTLLKSNTFSCIAIIILFHYFLHRWFGKYFSTYASATRTFFLRTRWCIEAQFLHNWNSTVLE